MFWKIAHHHPQAFSFSRSWYLGLFAFGSAAAWLSRNRRFSRIPWLAIATALGAAFIGVLFATRARAPHLSVRLDLLLGLATSTLFVSIAQRSALGRRSLVARILAARPCVALGVFSYSLYLINEPLLVLATRLLARTSVSDAGIVALVYLVVIPLILAVAYAFSLAFERPFISSFRRRAEQRLLHTEAAT
jgi:peptidoglycan/LPS O-acetylase OafA/YrhL